MGPAPGRSRLFQQRVDRHTEAWVQRLRRQQTRRSKVNQELNQSALPRQRERPAVDHRDSSSQLTTSGALSKKAHTGSGNSAGVEVPAAEELAASSTAGPGSTDSASVGAATSCATDTAGFPVLPCIREGDLIS